MITYQNQEYELKGKTSDSLSHIYIPRNTYSEEDGLSSEKEYYKKNIINDDMSDIQYIYRKNRRVKKKEIIPKYAKLEISFILFASLSFAIISMILIIIVPTNSISVLLILASIGFFSLMFPLLYLSKKIG